MSVVCVVVFVMCLICVGNLFDVCVVCGVVCDVFDVCTWCVV